MKEFSHFQKHRIFRGDQGLEGYEKAGAVIVVGSGIAGIQTPPDLANPGMKRRNDIRMQRNLSIRTFYGVVMKSSYSNQEKAT
jgi:hypothetical protein